MVKFEEGYVFEDMISCSAGEKTRAPVRFFSWKKRIDAQNFCLFRKYSKINYRTSERFRITQPLALLNKGKKNFF